jgi:hypothetical protein
MPAPEDLRADANRVSPGNLASRGSLSSLVRSVSFQPLNYVTLDNSTSTPGNESSQPNAFRYDGNCADQGLLCVSNRWKKFDKENRSEGGYFRE